MNIEENKMLALNVDILFKEVLSKPENNWICKDFLESIIGEKIYSIKTLKEVSLEESTIYEKGARLDLLSIVNEGIIVNVEMQNNKYEYMEDRILRYNSRLIASSIRKGEDYNRIKKVITIAIVNFNMYSIKEYSNRIIHVINNHRELEVLKKQSFIVIELPKFVMIMEKDHSKLADWLSLVYGRNEVRLNMAKNRNKSIAVASNEIKRLFTPELIEAVNEHRKEMWEEQLYYAKQDGIVQGIERGIEQEKENILKRLKKLGVSKEIIAEVMA